MPRTLIVTNDFPPREGGIQSFVFALASRLPAEELVVYTSSSPGSAAFDRSLPFRVIRDKSSMLVPTARVAAEVTRIFRRERCTAVVYGAAAPLGLLGTRLREAGATRQIGLTHGHEVWWARLPGTRKRMCRIGEGTDVLTYLGEYTRTRIGAALTPAARGRMVRLPPGVDTERFRPGAGGARIRQQLGIASSRQIVLCLSRLVPRKGQDMLIRSFPAVLKAVPDALLVLVGGGKDRSRLERLAARNGVQGSVFFTGKVPEEDLPAYYDAADVFAMPCRTRHAGMDVEGLGIVFLEASASGVPVVVGNSGGAPDAVIDGETGYLVNPNKPRDIAGRIVELLQDPELARKLGDRGREWVTEEWNWDDHAARLQRLLEL